MTLVDRRLPGALTVLMTALGYLLLSVNSLASGGACPSGVLVTGNNCYFIAANGSDSNNGTSESTPWLHAPGMPSCSANCAAVAPSAGEGFIFRGGDAWHNNNSSASPYVGGGGWNWTWNGASGSPIYVGVDPAWFSGTGWTRPVLSDDNPLSTTAVSACTYLGGGMEVSANYVTLDNIEFFGRCQSGSNGVGASSCSSNCDSSILFIGGNDQDDTFSNLYFHGWSHAPFSCSFTTELNGTCDTLVSIYDMMQITDTNHYVGIVMDGADSDPRSGGCLFGRPSDMHDCVCRNASQGYVVGAIAPTTAATLTFHDNLIEYIYESGDGVRHANGYELNGCINSGCDESFYNNVIRNITDSIVVLWFAQNGNLFYYNNIVDETGYTGGNFWDTNTTSGTYYVYNNTFVNGQFSNGVTVPLESTNNHLIAWGFQSNTRVTETSDISQTVSQANAQGYTASNEWSPTSTTGSTVGAGTNLTSSCGTNFSTLCHDATQACVYNTSNHTVSCPARTSAARPSSGAWDVGAYQFSGSSAPNPPTNLSATPH